jgi:hypothetical protein
MAEDISEAAQCLALNRPTACVFHLMRVMETGVQILGNRLGIQLTADEAKNVFHAVRNFTQDLAALL